MNYKITFKLASPLITYEPILFDALLLYAQIREEQGIVKQALSIDEVIELNDGLLVKDVSGVWRSSIMLSNTDPLLSIANFTKHFDTKHIDLIANRKLSIDTQRGTYKSYNLPYETKQYYEVYFIIDTNNIDKVVYLIEKHIYNLGKKRHRGYGEIRNIEVTETSEKILRPIPDKNGDIYLPAIPPYWRNSDLVLQKITTI